MNYPKVIDEFQTIERALAGENLARYGDGELGICVGRDCISQRFDAKLQAELRGILLKPPKGVLPCIPNIFSLTPKASNWLKFSEKRYVRFYNIGMTYGSSFVTRPDSAPWIDSPEYWARVTDLWRGKDVLLVAGTERSLRADMLTEASSLKRVNCPREHAYAEIDRIESEIGTFSGPVLLCVGATSTVLAARLARKGIWATDLGHIGMFMRHSASYGHDRRNLITDEYRALNVQLHASPDGYGSSGHRHAGAVERFAIDIGAASVLDYGCGEGTLKIALGKRGSKLPVREYDPAIAGKDAPPKGADLVVCTDVMEHVEPALIDNVLAHIRALSVRGCYMTIAVRPANKVLADGRNAHLTVEGMEWWVPRVEKAGFKVLHSLNSKINQDGSPREFTLWL